MTNIEVAKIMVSGMKCMLSREQIHELADILVCRKFKKGERILDEGEVCRSMLYLEKGLTRQFYFKYDKDLTEHIAYEGGVVICLESYLKEEPTRLMIETLEPTIAWDIPKDKIEELALKDAEIGVWYRKLFEASLIESQVKADTLRFEPAHERYNKLLQLHPEILKRAPLVYIASLLQMTPETERISKIFCSYKKEWFCLEQNHSCFNHHFLIESLVVFICPGPSVSTGKEQAEFLCQAIFQTYSRLDSI